MVIGKIKPTATIVAQFAAGVEIDAIQHEGKMYLPVVGMGEFSAKETTERPTVPSDTKPAAQKPESHEETPKGTSSYTEDELSNMSTKELLKMCKDLNINPDEYEGKNTNKKLRLLILNAQSGDKGESEDDAEEEHDDSSNDYKSQVTEILEDFDAGKMNRKKTIAAICELANDADEATVTKLIHEFEDDADADINDMADKISEVLSGNHDEGDSEDSEDADDADLVSPEDLEVGDRVSVWWDDDNQEWFDGEVKSIKKGKVVIAYDDDSEEAIDPEIHTKIKRLAD